MEQRYDVIYVLKDDTGSGVERADFIRVADWFVVMPSIFTGCWPWETS